MTCSRTVRPRPGRPRPPRPGARRALWPARGPRAPAARRGPAGRRGRPGRGRAPRRCAPPGAPPSPRCARRWPAAAKVVAAAGGQRVVELFGGGRGLLRLQELALQLLDLRQVPLAGLLGLLDRRDEALHLAERGAGLAAEPAQLLRDTGLLAVGLRGAAPSARPRGPCALCRSVVGELQLGAQPLGPRAGLVAASRRPRRPPPGPPAGSAPRTSRRAPSPGPARRRPGSRPARPGSAPISSEASDRSSTTAIRFSSRVNAGRSSSWTWIRSMT